MCGIAGILRHDGSPVERDLIERMTTTMVHRGPDDHGIFLDRGVGLGHRRLSIIDRAGGHQPLSNEDGTVWITYNGEIYNFREIRDELVARGHRFRTQSDTEVIVHLYEDLGEGCVHRLHGMFAFAIWDRRAGSLFLARDRMGIKPLYYRAGDRTFTFASEIRALRAAMAERPSIEPQAVHDYLTYRYTPAPLTIWKDVFKLAPGHVMSVKDGRVTVKQYWDLDFSRKVTLPEEDLIDECRRQLEASTVSHLVGEVPHGVFLSGGLDSTVILGMVAKHSGGKVKTFSVGFQSELGNRFDELPYARTAAHYFAADHHELAMTGRQYVDGLKDFIAYMEEPMADPSSIPLFYLSKMASGSVTVMLSGEGSDELLAGYSFWQPLKGYRRAEWFGRIPRPIRRWAIDPLNRFVFRSPRLAQYLMIADDGAARYFQFKPAQMTAVFSEEMKRDIYGPALQALDLRPSDETVRQAYRHVAHFAPLDQMLYVYAKQWLPDDLLLKADKMTMAHSLELRVPFLDHTFVEFAAGLPAEMKLRRGGPEGYVGKYILRKAVEADIPASILNRTKLGFSVPVWTLFESDLRTMAWDVIHSRPFRQSGLFDDRRIASVLKEGSRLEGDWWHLWPLLVFGLWQQEFAATV